MASQELSRSSQVLKAMLSWRERPSNHRNRLHCDPSYELEPGFGHALEDAHVQALIGTA